MARRDLFRTPNKPLPPQLPAKFDDLKQVHRFLGQWLYHFAAEDDPVTISTKVRRVDPETFGAAGQIVWQSVVLDNGGMWSSTHPTRLTAVQPGWHTVKGNVIFSGTGTAIITLNGVNTLSSIGPVNRASVGDLFPMQTGDYVELTVANDVAAATFSLAWRYSSQER